MKRIKLKNKSKKKFNFIIFKFLFFIIFIIILIIYTVKYLIGNSSNMTSDKYLSFILNKSYNKNQSSFVIKESIKLLSGIDLNNPSTFISNDIKNSSYEDINIPKDATALDDDYSTDIYDKITTYIENSSKIKDNPIIYIYNSHQLETYSNEGLNNNISPNVLMVSYLLSEKLNKNGISTIAEDTNIKDFIRISNLESDAFYKSTRIFIKNAISKYSSLKYFIDIHRDSVNKDISTCTINNKKYARILFVLGTTNPNYKENENVMKSLDELSDKYYKGLSRGIYKRPTPSWPDSYNQDLNSGVILIEVGAKENDLDEVANTIDALAFILEKYIKGDN